MVRTVKRELIDNRGNCSRITRTNAREVNEASGVNEDCDSGEAEDCTFRRRVLRSKYLTVKNRISGNLISHHFSEFLVCSCISIFKFLFIYFAYSGHYVSVFFPYLFTYINSYLVKWLMKALIAKTKCMFKAVHLL